MLRDLKMGVPDTELKCAVPFVFWTIDAGEAHPTDQRWNQDTDSNFRALFHSLLGLGVHCQLAVLWTLRRKSYDLHTQRVQTCVFPT